MHPNSCRFSLCVLRAKLFLVFEKNAELKFGVPSGAIPVVPNPSPIFPLCSQCPQCEFFLFLKYLSNEKFGVPRRSQSAPKGCPIVSRVLPRRPNAILIRYAFLLATHNRGSAAEQGSPAPSIFDTYLRRVRAKYPIANDHRNEICS